MRPTLFLLLLMPSIALGQITIPDKVAPYDPIVAGCNCIVPQGGKPTFMWSWDKASKVIQSDDTFKLYIWAPPGAHSVDAVVLVQIFKDVQIVVPDPNNPSDTSKWTLKTIQVIDSVDFQHYSKEYIVGDSPTPVPVPPGPTPPGPTPPGPTPPGPTPTDDFSKQAQAWLKAVPAASYKKETATAIADNFQATASQAVATSGWNLNAFVTDTKNRNRATLTPAELAAWGTPFFQPLAQYQAKLFNDRKLTETDVAGIAKIWKETSDAIRAAAF